MSLTFRTGPHDAFFLLVTAFLVVLNCARSVSKDLCYLIDDWFILLESCGEECTAQELSSRGVFLFVDSVDYADRRLTIPKADVSSTLLRLDWAHVGVLQSFHSIDEKATWPVADIVACGFVNTLRSRPAFDTFTIFSWHL
jgi:hypothetical protein